jgi:RNA 3'-terminal phosphate cyclase (ATP)
MISIDGRTGEGGGQILRTSLSLSLITGLPFTINNIRSGREKPGLSPQHLKAVKLSQEIGGAQVDGAELRSTRLTFNPKKIRCGKYQANIGTAGSTSLVLQTVYLPLSTSSDSSKITLVGGTHVPFAPTFDWLNLNWLLYLKLIGLDMTLDMDHAGFYPQGGGKIFAQINPVDGMDGLRIPERGALEQIRGISSVANLSPKIAERQREQVIRRLGSHFPLNDIRIKQLPSKNKGTCITLICEFEHSQCCYSALGAPGKPAEKVADEVCNKIETLLSTQATFDEYLADQLLLPLSLARSNSTFSCVSITKHIRTNAEVIKAFINPKIEIIGNTGSPGTINIHPNLQ